MRKLYWAFLAHLKEGRMLYCDRQRHRDGMVRVRVEIIKPKPAKAKKS